MKLLVVVDNRLKRDDLLNDWGLSIFVDTGTNKLLFDVDTSWDVVYHNIRKLDVPLKEIEAIVISHMHYDHDGGLPGIKKELPDVPVYLPESSGKCPGGVVVKKPTEIFSGVIATGPVPGGYIKEQALVLSTEKGAFILVGCSHPGVPRIIEKVASMGYKIRGIMGGFHIDREGVPAVARAIEKYNISMVGPGHCTSDAAIELIRKKFPTQFLEVYTGLEIEL